MTPLIAFVGSLLGGLVGQALRRPGRFGEFYPKSASGTMTEYTSWTTMQAANVTWLIEPGEAIWVESRYLRPMEGNIFDPAKLGAVAKAVESGQDITLMAPFGQVMLIDTGRIAESLAYDNVPWTTGDDELDEWLKDPEAYLEARGYEPDEAAEIQAEMEEELAEAVATGRGDLGKWMGHIRDGNHRTFGAVLGGAEAVAVRIYDNDVQDIQETLRSGGAGPRRPAYHEENLALLAKAIEDTGEEPWWLQRCRKVGLAKKVAP